MKKKRMLTALALCGVLMAGTAWAQEETEIATEAVEETESATEAVEELAEESTEAEIVSEVVELGDRPDYRALDYVTVGEYKDLPVEVDPITVTEEQIDSAIASEISYKDLYDVVTEGAVEQGDIANIDYEGKKDDVAFDGGTAQGTDLEIGSHTFIDGFEDGLIGVAIGDTVDLNLTFPEQYPAEDLAGAEVVFTVTVNSVKRMPQITDELVSSLSDGEYTTVEAYREYEREQLTQNAESSQESLIVNELMTQLYNTCTVDSYPQELLDYSIQEMNNYYAEYAESYGMSLDDFISEYMGMEREAYDAEAEEAVKQSLTQELILMAIAETEGVAEITDEEYEEGCAAYAQTLGYPDVDTFREAYDENRIRMSLVMDRSMELVRENAVILVNEPETESEVTPEEAVTEAVTE